MFLLTEVIEGIVVVLFNVIPTSYVLPQLKLWVSKNINMYSHIRLLYPYWIQLFVLTIYLSLAIQLIIYLFIILY